MNIKELMESGSNVSVTMNLADLKEVHFFQRMPQNNVACFKGNGDRAC